MAVSFKRKTLLLGRLGLELGAEVGNIREKLRGNLTTTTPRHVQEILDLLGEAEESAPCESSIAEEVEGLLDSTSQYGGDAASLSNVAAGAAFSHGMMGLEGSLVPGGARQVPMEQSWAEMQDQDKHAFLIKNKLSRISQAGMDLRMLPQQSDDELLVVGLSVVELTRLHLAFGRLAPEEGISSFLARLELSVYTPAFDQHDINLDTIELLTDDDLQDIGITDESHRNTLLSAALPRRCSPNHSSTLVSSEQRSKDGNGQSGHGFSKHFEADGCDESPKLREMGNHKTGADIAGASSERDMDEMDQINLNDTDEGYGQVYKQYMDHVMSLSPEEQTQNVIQIFRDLFVERATVVSELCCRLRESKNRERSLNAALEMAFAVLKRRSRQDQDRQRSNAKCNGTTHAESEDILDISGLNNMLIEESVRSTMGNKRANLREPITMIIRSFAILSAGRSSAFRAALMDGLAPILRDVADEDQLLHWCREECEQKCSKMGLIPAIRVQLAQKILQLASSRAELQRKDLELQTVDGREGQAPDSEKVMPTEHGNKPELFQRSHPSSSSMNDQPSMLDLGVPDNVSLFSVSLKGDAANCTVNNVMRMDRTKLDQVDIKGNGDTLVPRHHVQSKTAVQYHSVFPQSCAIPTYSPSRTNSPVQMKGRHFAEFPGLKTLEEGQGGNSPSPQTTPRSPRPTACLRAGLGIKLAADQVGFPVVVGFEDGFYPCPKATEDGQPNLEIGCKILSVDCHHTQFVSMSEIYNWLQGSPGSQVMIAFTTQSATGRHKDGSSTQWEVVLQRTALINSGSLQHHQNHHYTVCLRRMLENTNQEIHKPIGIGIILDNDSEGRFRVASVQPGGSAHKSGHVREGDLLFSINGLRVQHRTMENVMQLIQGAPGTRSALVLVTGSPNSACSHPGQDVILLEPLSTVPQIDVGQPGDLVAVIVGASGLSSSSMHPAVFCQLRIVDLSSGGELREELVGVQKAGLALGMRVIKSRYLIDREMNWGYSNLSEGDLGTISHFEDRNDQTCTCTVLWDNGTVQEHDVGRDNQYDLEVAPQMTTICKDLDDTRWDNIISLRVREPTSAALEITIWDRESYIGETYLPVHSLMTSQGEFNEHTLEVSFEEQPTLATLQLSCAYFPTGRRIGFSPSK